MYYIDDFEEYIINQGKAKSTARAYVSDIYELEDYLKSWGKEFENAEPDDIKAFLNQLKMQGKSDATINRRISCYKSFYKYIILRCGLTVSPLDSIKSKKVDHKEIIYLTEDEIVTLIELPDDTALGIRDRALLELMYASGIRVQELCDLKLEDLNLKIGYISIKSSGKSRMVPLGKPCQYALLTYLQDSRDILRGKKEDCGALFLSYLGEKMTRQGIWKILKSYAQKTDFAEKVSPQSIRNTFAAHLVMNGADIKSLQELLGHEDIMATKIYLSLSKNRILDVYDKAFPRA